jgi:hypothetical protein
MLGAGAAPFGGREARQLGSASSHGLSSRDPDTRSDHMEGSITMASFAEHVLHESLE